MDSRDFDRLTRTLAAGHSRRSLLKGLLGLGGAAAVTTVTHQGADAQWSVQVCLPDGSGGYTSRLIPKSSVSLYQRQYGAILPTNGVCPACQGGFKSCNGSCIPTSACCTDIDCTPPQICQSGSCLCTPTCAGKECGDDGCGGSCGTCGLAEVCQGGTCVCVPDCAGKNCGDDGCGGSCGTGAGQLVCGGNGTAGVCGCADGKVAVSNGTCAKPCTTHSDCGGCGDGFCAPTFEPDGNPIGVCINFSSLSGS